MAKTAEVLGLHPKCRELMERARLIVPDGSQTASKSPRRFTGPGTVLPAFVSEAKGAYFRCPDGARYLDFCMGLCPMILGYGDPDVESAAISQMQRAMLGTLPSPLEVELSEELISHWTPWAEMVRFFKTGSEATSAAVRLSRAVTSRSKVVIIRPGYSGWHDWAISDQKPGLGIPPEVKALTISALRGNNDFLEAVLFPFKREDAPAAVVMEPWITSDGWDRGPLNVKYLEEVRGLCTSSGVMLIFDEIVTGIRSDPSISQHAGVIPDLMTLGKAMGNGFPIAALVGRRELMSHVNQDEVFASGTYGGEMVSLAASLATLKKLREDDHSPEWCCRLDRMRGLGEAFLEAVKIQADSIHSQYHPPKVSGAWFRFVMEFPDKLVSDLFQQECAKRWVLFTGAHNLSWAHLADEGNPMRELLGCYGEVFSQIKGWVDSGNLLSAFLEGEPSRPAFRRQ